MRAVNFMDAFLLDPDQHFKHIHFYIDFESVHALRPINTLEIPLLNHILLLNSVYIRFNTWHLYVVSEENNDTTRTVLL